MFPKIQKLLEMPDNNYVDSFNMLGGAEFRRPELFCMNYPKPEDTEKCDRSHPAVEGHRVMAEEVRHRILGQWSLVLNPDGHFASKSKQIRDAAD